VADLKEGWQDVDGCELLKNTQFVVKIDFVQNFLFREGELAIFAYQSRWA
jgi:hypothetical protein